MLPDSRDPHWLWKVAFSQRPWSFIASAGVLIGFLCNATVPIVVGRAIDDFDQPITTLGRWIAVLAVVFALNAAAMFLGRYFMVRSELRLGHQLRTQVTDRIQDPRGMAGQHHTAGGLLSIASTDTNRVARIVFLTVFPVAEIGSLIYVSIMVLLINVPLGLVVLIAGPVTVFISLQAAKPLRSRSARRQSALAQASSLATDVMQGLRVVKGLGAVDTVRRRYRRVSDDAYAATVSANGANAGLTGTTEFTGAVYVTVVGVTAGFMALGGSISIGELITVVGLTQFIITPMTMLGRNFASKIATAQASAERIRRVLNAEFAHPDFLDERAARSAAESALGRLIEPGLHVLNQAEAADILRALEPLRTPRVIVAPHQADLFDGTVAENILPGAADSAKTKHALSVAACQDIPGGAQTRVGEGGRLLSGGQRQRVALARAIAADPDVLILQDPTSAVDSVTQQRIADNVAAARCMKTTIVITEAPAWLAHSH